MSAESTRSRMIGFAALGALILLASFAFYSGGSGSATPPPDPTQADPAPPAVSRGAAEVADLPPVPPPDLTQSIPEVGAGTTITAVASDIALSPQARLLAERFQCVCGCGDILSTCSCEKIPGSRDMKALLQKLVDEGRTPGEIRDEMIATYGPSVIP